MDYKINKNEKSEAVNEIITDCTHLIDLPPVENVFDQKVKGNSVNHPKAGIKTLTVFFHKNGLANLL
ncbi:hypothetical protein ACTJKC_20030 [Pedobacter sp. 22226]|uniref:hypothetical protein n=1 Tax=Pedobacter sp. 22226 TaxID=3453894 RepID=UPI003F85D59D